MNRLRICSLFFAFAVIAARAEETNTPSTASATSNAAPSGVTSNALPASITIDGHTYENVRWVRTTAADAIIYHSTGVATIPLEKLPPELQKHFGYDPAKAVAWRVAEQQRAIAAEQAQRQAQQRENARRALLAQAKPCQCDVVSVVEGQGLICDDRSFIDANSAAGGTNPTAFRPVYFFLVYDTRGIVNNQHVQCQAYPDGDYTYTTVSGASQKIHRWVYCGPWQPPKP